MKQIICALILLGISSGCATDGGPGDGQTLRPLPEGYALRDTSAYETFNSSGRYALLYDGARPVDTVDLDFGVHAVGRDSLVFLPVRRSEGSPPGETWHTTGTHTLALPGQLRLPLGHALPYLNDNFSSPALIGGRMYYWGLAPQSGQLYAMRYDFTTQAIDSLALDEKVEPTDFRFHLTPPHEADSAVVFVGQGKRRLIDPGRFSMMRVEALPRGT